MTPAQRQSHTVGCLTLSATCTSHATQHHSYRSTNFLKAIAVEMKYDYDAVRIFTACGITCLAAGTTCAMWNEPLLSCPTASDLATCGRRRRTKLTRVN